MELPKELRSLVKHSVAILGRVIQRELGTISFQRIEALRVGMAEMRELPEAEGFLRLQKHYKKLEALKPQEQHEIAHGFTLMLELMNSCENAYRSHRLNFRSLTNNKKNTARRELPSAIVYVLTAHPTEARSPQNIAIFHEIQNILIQTLNRANLCEAPDLEVTLNSTEETTLKHALEIAWRTPIVRSRIPKVKDEADHIYSLLFRDEILFSLIEDSDREVPFFVRSWVGGDKDGHPGVNEKTLLQSLLLSRIRLLDIILAELSAIRKTLQIFPSASLQKKILQLHKIISRLRRLKASDAKLVKNFSESLAGFSTEYIKSIGTLHPRLRRITRIIRTFPALVVPLELRESSEVLMSPVKDHKKLAIFKMLRALEKISRGGNPRSYVRGFIVSMTGSIAHLLAAADFQRSVFGNIPVPVIPLFEDSGSLAKSDSIMTEFTKNPIMKKAANQYWNNQIEMMVGYSDSAKEAGVLASRLAISAALPRLEKVCTQAGLVPVFFHGSGGSIDRGGGSIEDQTAWWPKSALRIYKVTIQGEMIERSLATAAIARSQVDEITRSAANGLMKTLDFKTDFAVEDFAKGVSEKYRARITSLAFLKLVESATPYSYLKILKIGSRPVKRTAQLTVKGLRAIPWVMCWTQTRVLFPTWWGVGTTWSNSSPAQKAALKIAFQKNPVFTSYIKALGFTLAKIELNIWKMYLGKSSLSKTEIESATSEFQAEFEQTCKCYFEICGQKELLWFRPWLGESINLRSPMIHPLNLLQIIAKQNKDPYLLRVTTTGISSGMLTTG